MIDASAIAGEALNVGRVVIPEFEPASDADDGPCCAVCVKSAGPRTPLRAFALEVTDESRIGRGRRVGRILLCKQCLTRAIADAQEAA